MLISCSKKENSELSEQTKLIVDNISRDSIMFDSSESWNKYLKLLGNASTEELVDLTTHKKPIVRCFAFDALCVKEYPKIREIFYYHENDTIESVAISSGCIRDRSLVRTYMFIALHPVSSNSKYKFSRKEFDSMYKNYYKRPAANSRLAQ